MKKETLFWIIVILLLVIGISYLLFSLKKEHLTITVKLPNPASQYCEQNGGTLDIRTNADSSQYGVCMKNGKECDEWLYFRGECQL